MEHGADNKAWIAHITWSSIWSYHSPSTNGREKAERTWRRVTERGWLDDGIGLEACAVQVTEGDDTSTTRALIIHVSQRRHKCNLYRPVRNSFVSDRRACTIHDRPSDAFVDYYAGSWGMRPYICWGERRSMNGDWKCMTGNWLPEKRALWIILNARTVLRDLFPTKPSNNVCGNQNVFFRPHVQYDIT